MKVHAGTCTHTRTYCRCYKWTKLSLRLLMIASMYYIVLTLLLANVFNSTNKMAKKMCEHVLNPSNLNKNINLHVKMNKWKAHWKKWSSFRLGFYNCYKLKSKRNRKHFKQFSLSFPLFLFVYKYAPPTGSFSSTTIITKSSGFSQLLIELLFICLMIFLFSFCFCFVYTSNRLITVFLLIAFLCLFA